MPPALARPLLQRLRGCCCNADSASARPRMHGRRHNASAAKPANSFGDAVPAAGRSCGGAQRAMAGDFEESVEQLNDDQRRAAPITRLATYTISIELIAN